MAFVSPLPVSSASRLSSQPQHTCRRCKAVAAAPKRPHTPINLISSPSASPSRSSSPTRKPIHHRNSTASSSTLRSTPAPALDKKTTKKSKANLPISLPHHTSAAEHLATRSASLARSRQEYQWGYEAVSDAAFIHSMPDAELPNRRWVVHMKRLEQQCIKNATSNTKSRLKSKKTIEQDSISNDTRESSDMFDNYKRLFNAIELPDIAKENAFLRDDVFAWYRVAGPNPMQIRSATRAEVKRFISAGLTDENFRCVKGFRKDSVQAALDQNRLYIADYSELSDMSRTDLPGRKEGKHLYAPVALFCVPAVPSGTSGLPLPIGIINEAAFCWAWEEEDRWNVAKLKVQVADAFVHETVHHFARTHLLAEALVCSTHRALDEYHPISVLLRSHFEGTAFINSTSLTQLLCEGGTIDKLTAPPIEHTRDLAARSLGHGFDFSAAMPDEDLDARGTMHDSLCFPYRDDALIIWKAILEFVKDVLHEFYKSDDDVVSDSQLQDWGREVVWAGRVTGFGELADGGFKSREGLIRTVAMVIFTASVQHAAVNFPQVTHMQFAPAMPLAGCSDNPHASYDDLVPGLQHAEEQLCAAQMLGVVRYTKLGEYGKETVAQLGMQDAVSKLQRKLGEVGKTIEDRNRIEKRAGLLIYDFLKPHLIPQSINV